MTERVTTAKWRDFSEMPDEVLRAFAAELSNPREALNRIRARKRAAALRPLGEKDRSR